MQQQLIMSILRTNINIRFDTYCALRISRIARKRASTSSKHILFNTRGKKLGCYLIDFQ